jgi:hypothetical protein
MKKRPGLLTEAAAMSLMIGFIGKIDLLDVNEIKSGILRRPCDGRMAHSLRRRGWVDFPTGFCLLGSANTIRHARGHRHVSRAIESVLMSSAIRWTARTRQSDTIKQK